MQQSHSVVIFGGYRMLILGRFLVGLGIGVSAVVVPAYLGELAPANLRGRIVELYEVLLGAGMLFALMADAALQHAPPEYNWRVMVGLPILPSILLAGMPSLACWDFRV